MNTLWPRVRLGDVLRFTPRRVIIESARTYREIGIRSHGRGIFHKPPVTGLDIGDKKVFYIEPDDFVLNIVFAWEGAVAVTSDAEAGMIASHRFPTFRPDPARLDVKYLQYWCQSELGRNLLDRVSPGGAGRNRTLNRDAFLNQEVALPPLAQQRRVVERIEDLAAQIHEARTLRQQAAEGVEALLAAASADFFRLKNGWKTMLVGEFCEPPQYGYTESATDHAVGPRFLRITDIQKGRVDWGQVPFCHCPEPTKYLLKAGDLVFARTGATTGKSFVIGDCPPAVFASYLIRLRVRDTVSVDYLYRYFQSPSYWEQIADEKKGTGQPNLNGSKLARLRVPIAPVSEQHQIVAELDILQTKVDALKQLHGETGADLDALLPAILDRAFKGEL